MRRVIGGGRQPRRAVLRGAVYGGSAGALWLLACGGGSKETSSSKPAAPEGVGRTGTQVVEEQPRPGGTFSWHYNANPPTLDPHRASAVTTMTGVSPVLSRLLRFKSRRDPELGYNRETEPDLALSVEAVDASTWTIKLRPDAKFHNVAPVNGRAVEAEDVKATFTRARETSNPNRGSIDFIDPAQIETPDKQTVVFKLLYPYAPFPKLIASGVYSWILPREAGNGFDPAKTPIGSGPFLFESFTPDVAAIYKKNPDWWEKGRPYVDGVRRAVIPDSAQRLAQFSAGNLDTVDVPLEDLEATRQRNPKAELITERDQGGPILYFQLGEANSPWQDVRLRRAVSMAIDREAFGKAMLAGRWDPAWNVPLNMGRWALKQSDLSTETQNYHKYNLAEAKKLITEAGAADMNVKLLYPVPHPRDPYLKTAAETIFSMLSQLPWKMTLVFIDYNKDWVGGGRGVRYGNFPSDSIVLTGVEGRTDVDEYIYGWWHSKSTASISRLKDSQLDSLVDNARKLVKDDERAKAYIDIQKYMADRMITAAGTPSGYTYALVNPSVVNHTTGDNYGVGVSVWSQLWLKR